MPQSPIRRRSMLPVANLVTRVGAITAVLACFALSAIIQQEVAGRSMLAVTGPAAGARPHPATAAYRPAAALLIRQVRATVSEQQAAVVHAAFGEKAPVQADVHLVRVDQAGGWAFGTCAIPPPAGMDAMPQPSMFVAHRSGKDWQVALSGTESFERLVRQAPPTVISAGQRPFLERYGRAVTRRADDAAGLALPWRIGQSWTVQSMAEMSGLHFAGGDGRVLASGAGRLYRLCARRPGQGMLLLIHPNGLASEYYQVTDVPDVKDGTLVEQGAYLGRTSTDRPCGGPPAKVRTASFTLMDGDGATSLDGAQIGGWILHAKGGRFYADRAGLRVDSGNPLLNFGSGGSSSPRPSPTATPTPDLATTSPEPHHS